MRGLLRVTIELQPVGFRELSARRPGRGSAVQPCGDRAALPGVTCSGCVIGQFGFVPGFAGLSRQPGRLGASASARITRQKMRAYGIRAIPAGPRTATRAHPPGLTQREREVLDLICARHTNAEIAARLFISAKIVDHHVSAVLAKLDAPTRNAAATSAARLGLVGAAKN